MTGLLIRGATVLDPETPLAQADVLVEGDVIVEVAPRLAPGGARVIDADGMILMPGLVNAHTHSSQSLDQGTTPNLPLDLWMMWAVYGGLELDGDELYTTAAAGALEMLRTGCTSVIDHAVVFPHRFHEHAEAVMSAYDDVGMRAGVAPLVHDRDFFESLPLYLVGDAEPLEPIAAPQDVPPLLRDLEAFLERWGGRHPRLTPLLGPSAPQRCSDEFLEGVAALSRTHGAGVHTHLLEARSQVLATRRRWGRSVVDQLDDLGLLGPHASYAHGVWLTDAEYATVRGSGSVLVHNPISNLRCGSGVMPVPQLLAAGTPLALGSDGAASNDNQNMFEAMKFGTLIQTMCGHHSTWPKPDDLWRMCVLGGAAALRQPVGRVAPGAMADLVLLRGARHTTVSKEGLVSSLVLSEHGESVATVVVGGEVVLEDGASTRVDEPAIMARARALNDKLHGHLDGRRQVYESAEATLTRMLDAVDDEPLDVERRMLSGPR
jgi:cytosine/adenosine deaminase-related metal-dependent hydrolase